MKHPVSVKRFFKSHCYKCPEKHCKQECLEALENEGMMREAFGGK